MKTASNLIILTGKVRSGKTTALSSFLNNQWKQTGFVCPDLNGKRLLIELQSKIQHTFQTDEFTIEPTIQIGKFIFFASVFERAKEIISSGIAADSGWFVVDEIGPLEIRGEGLEPALGDFITYHKNHPKDLALILVVRDKLLDAVIQKYNLKDSPIIYVSHLQLWKNLAGVILCGGKSQRMGTSKALLEYLPGKPQYQRVGELLQRVSSQVILSAGQTDVSSYNESYSWIADVEVDQGPMAGILAAFRFMPGKHLLVCGCDYPLLRFSDIINLMVHFEVEVDAVCYHNENSGISEPLVAIYHARCAPLLEAYYAAGYRSMRSFLQTIQTKKLTINVQDALLSSDEPATFQSIKNLMK
ncbi:MAG: NTP transferase domain-containing protein [Saprospiraceae bacterium]|nr:NTP transferase domain-containing protein [Saprospiraceae bacterium]